MQDNCKKINEYRPVISAYHAKYYAHELTRRCPPDSAEKLAGAVASAQVDLNPHQVDAALFAFKSPLSKGALLADEVGLGKTIEAGLVLSQKWAERKRRILVITPSNLRKQWYQELTEKFFLPCRLLESRFYNAAIKQGQFRPFEVPEIVICSYQFAKSKAGDVQAVPWDLVVIDEAHRLRNVYKPANVIANTLKLALAGKHKLLLTATPLQNSLLELFGLVSFIDEHTFGDLKSFREQFANLNQEQVFQTLKARLKPVCHRTLRRQVTAYIPYTKRLPLVEEFTPEESEDRLYHLVSEYLQRDNLHALPASQRSLMTLVLRKLLASSTFAIAGALTSISNRLKTKLRKQEPGESLEDELDQDYEALDETAEEWTDEFANNQPVELLTEDDRRALEQEIADLDAFAQLATSIEHNAKGKALLKALGIAFAKAKEIGAAQKAIIFTESRRTQSYLLRVLADSPFREGIVLFNGSNTDDGSKLIYSQWLERHQGSDRVTGSRSADMRSALVDYFRDESGKGGRIMIATEAGAEGINLQFCSLVVNYDLPWNPQRIEQRIGRCHRYGQKHDVVVVNFINRYERLLMQLTRHELEGQAEFLGDASFRLTANPFPQQATAIPLGLYELPRRSGEAHLYRLNHPLAEALIANAKSRDLPAAEMHFDYGQHDGKVTTLEPLIGKTGWLALSSFSVEALDQAEDHLIFSAITDDGQPLDDEIPQRLLTLEDKLAGQKQIKALEAQRNQKRRTLFDAQDQVDKQREELIAQIERKLAQTTRDERLFAVRWRLA